VNPYAEAARRLAGTPFSRIDYREATDSTNEDAARLLGNDGAAGLTIVAEYQRRGSGRKGRSWIAPAGTSLLFTTILPRPIVAGHLWSVTFWSALAVREALQRCGIVCELHWPNDLLSNDRKLCGILCRSRVVGERAWVACGVGINVARPRADEEAIEPPPAYCDDTLPVDRRVLLSEILKQYDERLVMLDRPRDVAAAWEREAGLPGRRYRILKDGERQSFVAVALALGANGELVVERDDRQQEAISIADARALR
jgi:BirA family biotin operon repressor/biotin-[acetyl-CoA-carboxylase] ligase